MRHVTALVAVVVLGGAFTLVASGPAQAVTGTATITPASGNNLNNPTVKTSAACSPGTAGIRVLLSGGNATNTVGGVTWSSQMPPDSIMGPPDSNVDTINAVSTTGYQTPFTFQDVYLDAGLTPYSAATGAGGLRGVYTLELFCSDGLSDTDVFTAQVNFTAYNAYTFVAPAPTTTTTTLSASPASPRLQGTNVTLTANVTPAAAAGTVQFKDGASNIGAAVAVSGGVATTSTTTLPVGTRSLTAVFTPSSSTYAASTSNSVSYVIQAPAANTTTTVAASPASPQLQGTSVTFTATVAPTGAAGTVQFKDGAANLGAPVAVVTATGKAILATTALNPGSHDISAVFTPTNPAAYNPSTSAAITYVITSPAPPTTTTLAVTPPSPADADDSVTLTATVAPAGAAGTVQFKDGATNLGSAVTVSGGTASFSTSSLTIGTHSLTAVFTPTDLSAWAPSTSSTVTYQIQAVPTSVALSASPSSPTTFGTSVSLSALVTPSTATGTVTFKDGSATVGSAPVVSGEAMATASNLAVGTRSLTAVFTGSGDFASSTSPAVSYVVNPATTTTTLAVTPASPQVFGTPVTLTATVAPAGVSGTVQFKDGATALGAPVALSGGTAVKTLSTLPVGTRSLTAAFIPSNGNASPSTSSATSFEVTKATTATSLAVTPASPKPFGTAMTLTATVTPAIPGTVQFKDGASNLGAAVAVAGGTASLTTSALSVGSHSLTAVFTPTDTASADGSTSAASTFVVEIASTTTTLTVSPATSAAQGAPVTLTAAVTPNAAGTVQFADGGTPIGASVAVASGTAALTTSTLALGAHSLTATFTPTDTASYSGSSSSTVAFTVLAATTTTLEVEPGSPQLFGTELTLTATVGPTGTAGTVVFKDGSTPLGDDVTVEDDEASVTIDTLTVGVHSLTAVFTPTDAANAPSTSAAVSFTVTAPEPTTGEVVAFDEDGDELPPNPVLEPGQEILVVADGFEPEEEVSATVNSTPISLAPATADADGVVAYALTIPTGLEAGQHTFVLQGATNTGTLEFRIAADDAPTGDGDGDGNGSGNGGVLSSTGFELTTGLLLGLGLLAAGLVALVGSRRESAGGQH